MKTSTLVRRAAAFAILPWAVGCAHSATLKLVDEANGAPVHIAHVVQHRSSNNYFSKFRSEIEAGSPSLDGSIEITDAVSSWDNVNVTVYAPGYWAAAVLFRGRDQADIYSPWTEKGGLAVFTGTFHGPEHPVNGSYTVLLYPVTGHIPPETTNWPPNLGGN